MNDQPITVPPGKTVRLADYATTSPARVKRQVAEDSTHKHVKALAPLAERLYAEGKHAVLLILQGMDAAGKDGTIRTVMHGVNPQSCQIVPFKTPTLNELQHDFLWRSHREVPRRGNIGIFNRSHYEDVLIVRVKSFVPESQWKNYYEHINAFEKLLTDTYVKVVKVFLHISKDEQRRRLQKRIDNPAKRWKFQMGDLEDRRQWDDYQHAYEEALTKCNTKYAPWYIVPADDKWYRNLVVSKLVRTTLESLDPQYPAPPTDIDGLVVK